MEITGKGCAVSIDGVRVIGSFKLEEPWVPETFTQERVQLGRGIQQLETLPTRERNWLVGYLEIKDSLEGVHSTKRQWKKLNEDRGDKVYPPSMWRRLSHAAVTFFGGSCENKLRHPRRIGEKMVTKLADLSGDSFWSVTEYLFSFQVCLNPTIASWHRIWTGE
jgi:hypothetical protein